jgi:tetratricopeptide (TPR) repeat protein
MITLAMQHVKTLSVINYYICIMIVGHRNTLQDFDTVYHKSNTTEAIFQNWSLILCLIIIICLSLLPAVLVYAKVGNNISLYYKGLVLHKSGNYTGAILYYKKVLAMDPQAS